MVAPTDESWYCSPALQACVHLSVLLEKRQKEEIAKDFSAKHESHYHEGSVDMGDKEWQRRDPGRVLLTSLRKLPKAQVLWPSLYKGLWIVFRLELIKGIQSPSFSSITASEIHFRSSQPDNDNPLLPDLSTCSISQRWYHCKGHLTESLSDQMSFFRSFKVTGCKVNSSPTALT